MKRFFLILAIVGLLIITCTSVSATEALLLGDINEDGVVSILDTQAILNHTTGIEILPDSAYQLADVDGNNEISINDAKYVLRLAGKMETSQTLEFSDWQITVEPTCSSYGEAVSYCLTNGMVRTKILPQKSHNIVEATCKRGSYCSACYQTLSEPTDHIESDWIIDEEATCYGMGSKHTKCLTCGEIVSETYIPQKEHALTDWIIDEEATCEDFGYHHIECKYCGRPYMEDFIYPTGHTESDWIIESEPTCLTQGYKYKECTDCGKILSSMSIPTNEHTPEIIKLEAKTPTCTETGLTEGSYCSICKEVIVAQRTISATGHTSNSWTIDIEPTCIKEGSKHRTCTVCGEIETVAINTIAHNTQCGVCGICGTEVGDRVNILIDDATLYFGMSTTKLKNTLGEPTEILNDSTKSYSIEYYVYASDYSKLTIFTCAGQMGIIGIYTTNPTTKIATSETISFGNVDEVYLVDNIFFEGYIDKIGTKDVYAFHATTVKETMQMHSGTNFRSCEKLIFYMVNACRSINGVATLEYSFQAAPVALSHSKDMADNNYFDHTNLNGNSPLDRLLSAGLEIHGCGENIAAGQTTSPYDFNNLWYNSSGHRSNMLNSNFKGVGIGIAYNETSTYKFYSTENFIIP